MALKINSGDLKHKIILKTSTKGVNNQGGKTVLTWTTKFTTSAMIKPVSNNLGTQPNASFLLDSKDFYFRWAEERAEIKKDWVLEYKGNDWVINQIEMIDEKQRFIRVNAKVRG